MGTHRADGFRDNIVGDGRIGQINRDRIDIGHICPPLDRSGRACATFAANGLRERVYRVKTLVNRPAVLQRAEGFVLARGPKDGQACALCARLLCLHHALFKQPRALATVTVGQIQRHLRAWRRQSV